MNNKSKLDEALSLGGLEMVKALVRILNTGDDDDERLAAAKEMLRIGYGESYQPIEIKD